LRQVYLIVPLAGLQCCVWALESAGVLGSSSREFQEEGFSQFAAKCLFRTFAMIPPFALKDFTGRRKFFAHLFQSELNAAPLFFY
jgi:hypothetical protein